MGRGLQLASISVMLLEVNLTLRFLNAQKSKEGGAKISVESGQRRVHLVVSSMLRMDSGNSAMVCVDQPTM